MSNIAKRLMNSRVWTDVENLYIKVGSGLFDNNINLDTLPCEYVEKYDDNHYDYIINYGKCKARWTGSRLEIQPSISWYNVMGEFLNDYSRNIGEPHVFGTPSVRIVEKPDTFILSDKEKLLKLRKKILGGG